MVFRSWVISAGTFVCECSAFGLTPTFLTSECTMPVLEIAR